MAILVAFGALIVGLRRDEAVVVPPTDTAVVDPVVVDPTLPAPAPPADEIATTVRAVAVVDEFVRAFNAGDLDGTLALLDPEVIGTRVFGSAVADPVDDELDDRMSIEIRIANGLGSGTELSVHDCVETDRGTRPDATSLVCRWEERTGVVQAIGGEPIPAEAVVSVTDGALAEIHLGVGSPNFLTLGRPFSNWLDRYHPEVAAALDVAPSDRDTSFDLGVTEVEWAHRWAEFLDTYECAADQFCAVSVERWVAEYDDQCLAEPESRDRPSMALFEYMRGVPPTVEQSPARRELMAVDAELLGVDGPAPPSDEVPALQQRRSDAMAQLGIAEACRPLPPSD